MTLFEKQSKAAQRAENSRKRNSWSFCPATRVIPDRRAENRRNACRGKRVDF